MTNVAKWSVSAGNNSDPPPAGAPEHMLRSDVNDVMREMMAAVRRWYEVTNAEKVATGTNAYVLATSNGFAAFTDLPILVFRVQNGNTAACTLNVDGLGVKNFFKFPGTVSPAVPAVPFAAGDLLAGQIVVAAYNTANGYFEMVGGRSPRDSFPVSTQMIFQMATPPVGWTKVNAFGDSSFRLIDGAAGVALTQGGTVGISTAFSATGLTGARILDYTMLPNTGNLTFSLAINSDKVDRTNNPPAGATKEADDIWCGVPDTGTAGAGSNVNIIKSVAERRLLSVRNIGVGGTITMAGGNLGHTHPMPELKYVDVIAALRS